MFIIGVIAEASQIYDRKTIENIIVFLNGVNLFKWPTFQWENAVGLFLLDS